ncbi:hypothetical protein [Laspinema olomoucense]|uniref:Uncharacterized protein n=1 Tax=Laspinema olomoucense D3b TaxID=2953688 RepID=A0ABT2NFH8_9CYAN|nr:hypothetical protein [Laspinema sp. D3b]MCT7981458.1 hypothetical protein [Laspinema sp. D3b]
MMYAIQASSSNPNANGTSSKSATTPPLRMRPEEFCDRFLPLRHPGDKLNARSGRRSRCIRFLAAVLSKFTGEIILESRIDKWGPGLTFSKIPCPFTSLLALLAQVYPDEIQKMGNRF